jgi:hypothetical protein
MEGAMSNRKGSLLVSSMAIALFLFQSRPAFSETVGPVHKSEPRTQVHQYVCGEAARIWPGSGGLILRDDNQADWDAFFAAPHNEVWDYVGARTVYTDVQLLHDLDIEDGTVTYGGRNIAPIVDITWTPPDLDMDMPYSEFDGDYFSLHGITDDDGSGMSNGNYSVGSWPNVGDDIIEGAHEEDLFFVHSIFSVLYAMYGNPEFNPASDYLQDEFFNALDYDAAEAFYHHLWRRKSHDASDIDMMGISWSNAQSAWGELIVMPDIYSPHPSPIQVAEGYWKSAVDGYLGHNGMAQDTGLAYYFLGRVAHLLVDLCVPAHAHCDPHGPLWLDAYESRMGNIDWYSQYRHDEVPVFDSSGVVTGTAPWTYNAGDWPYKSFDYVRYQIPGTKWAPSEPDDQIAGNQWNAQSDLFRLFWCTAEIADNFDSNDANGEEDGGARRALGFSNYELREIAGELMPQAMISVAELYKLFQETVEAQGLTQIGLVSPANESVLSSTPTFVWTPDGGTNNAFAVDLSASPGFESYYSTYEQLHQPINDTSWTMPVSIWNMIPVGRDIYWRVRGADLDVMPLTIITSDEVWSFTRQ